MVAENLTVPEVREIGGSCFLSVRVTPRASKTEILGVAAGRLRVRLQAPPVDGAANKALTEFLAKTLSFPRSAVTLEHGETGREKIVRITGVSRTALVEKLAGLPW